MRINLSHIAPLLAAGAAAVAIGTAPTATAATATHPAPAAQACHGADPVCPNTHSTLINQAPGNNQIDASPGPVGFAPQYPYAEGDFYGYGGYGGFGHGGGFGGGHGGGGGHGR